MAGKKYWLFKSEPTEFSFADLLAEPDQTAEWDGVRNYQVRNMMRDDMNVGDEVLFYHSSTNPHRRHRYSANRERGVSRRYGLDARRQALRPAQHARQPRMAHGGHPGARPTR